MGTKSGNPQGNKRESIEWVSEEEYCIRSVVIVWELSLYDVQLQAFRVVRWQAYYAFAIPESRMISEWRGPRRALISV